MMSNTNAEEAFQVCLRLIDFPGKEYRIVKQAVVALVALLPCLPHHTSVIVQKILQVIQRKQLYRSNPRRFAVRSIGVLTYSDPSLVISANQLLQTLAAKGREESQYVRKAAFCALSRIARLYPETQESLIPFFMQHYQSAEKSSVRWGVVIGLGRIAQSNAKLRSDFANEWISQCHSTDFRMRWAGIKGLGHACCPVGNVQPDTALQRTTVRLATAMFYGSKAIRCPPDQDPWQEEEVYLVQYAAVSALGLILRSDPDLWWKELSPLLCDALCSPRVAAMVKAAVLLTFGKLTFYLSPENQYYGSLERLLFHLSAHENVLVSEPATYALCNFAISHPELAPRVKTLLRSKMGADITHATDEAYLYYFRSWAKFVSTSWKPVLNICSSVQAKYTQSTVADDVHARALSLSEQLYPLQSMPLNNTDTFLSAPDFESKISSTLEWRESTVSEDEAETGRGASMQPLPSKSTHPFSEIAGKDNLLLELCTEFSAAIIESVALLLQEQSLLADSEFLKDLHDAIVKIQSGEVTPDQTGLLIAYRQISTLSMELRQNAVAILKCPDLLFNPLWIKISTPTDAGSSAPSVSSQAPLSLSQPATASPTRTVKPSLLGGPASNVFTAPSLRSSQPNYASQTSLLGPPGSYQSTPAPVYSQSLLPTPMYLQQPQFPVSSPQPLYQPAVQQPQSNPNDIATLLQLLASGQLDSYQQQLVAQFLSQQFSSQPISQPEQFQHPSYSLPFQQPQQQQPQQQFYQPPQFQPQYQQSVPSQQQAPIYSGSSDLYEPIRLPNLSPQRSIVPSMKHPALLPQPVAGQSSAPHSSSHPPPLLSSRPRPTPNPTVSASAPARSPYDRRPAHKPPSQPPKTLSIKAEPNFVTVKTEPLLPLPSLPQSSPVSHVIKLEHPAPVVVKHELKQDSSPPVPLPLASVPSQPVISANEQATTTTSETETKVPGRPQCPRCQENGGWACAAHKPATSSIRVNYVPLNPTFQKQVQQTLERRNVDLTFIEQKKVQKEKKRVEKTEKQMEKKRLKRERANARKKEKLMFQSLQPPKLNESGGIESVSVTPSAEPVMSASLAATAIDNADIPHPPAVSGAPQEPPKQVSVRNSARRKKEETPDVIPTIRKISQQRVAHNTPQKKQGTPSFTQSLVGKLRKQAFGRSPISLNRSVASLYAIHQRSTAAPATVALFPGLAPPRIVRLRDKREPVMSDRKRKSEVHDEQTVTGNANSEQPIGILGALADSFHASAVADDTLLGAPKEVITEEKTQHQLGAEQREEEFEKQRRSKRQEVEATPREMPLCTFFQSGRCTKEDCPFKHELSNEPVPKINESCRYFRAGVCHKGDACPYLHLSADVQPCRFYHLRGTCANTCCRFSHDPISAEKRMELESALFGTTTGAEKLPSLMGPAPPPSAQ